MKNVDEALAYISKFSLDDLNKLKKAVSDLIEQKSADELKLQDIINFAKSKGIELSKEDLQPSKPNDGRTQVKDKYRYVDAYSKEWLWSGRGRKPKWAKAMSDEKLKSCLI
jgi:DNA-binding protein H-NS